MVRAATAWRKQMRQEIDPSGILNALLYEASEFIETQSFSILPRREALRALPLDQRAPLVLTTFGGYTHAETGRILGISESAAKVRAHRARRALADVLQEWR